MSVLATVLLIATIVFLGIACILTVALAIYILKMMNGIRERHVENRKRIGGWW